MEQRAEGKGEEYWNDGMMEEWGGACGRLEVGGLPASGGTEVNRYSPDTWPSW